jgi:hypothetical protein
MSKFWSSKLAQVLLTCCRDISCHFGKGDLHLFKLEQWRS